MENLSKKLISNKEEMLERCAEGTPIRREGFKTVKFNNLTSLQKQIFKECLYGKSIEEIGIEEAKYNLGVIEEDENCFNNFDPELEHAEDFYEVERLLNSFGDYTIRKKGLIQEINENYTEVSEDNIAKIIIPEEHILWNHLGIVFGFTEYEVQKIINRNRVFKELELRLNTYLQINKMNYSLKIFGVDKEELIILHIFYNGSKKLPVILEAKYTDDTEELIQRLISELYENYINPCSSEIRSWKQFVTRKARSLKLWVEKENQDKVNKINLDMVEKYDRMIKAKNEKEVYKQFAYMFFNIKSNLESKIA